MLDIARRVFGKLLFADRRLSREIEELHLCRSCLESYARAPKALLSLPLRVERAIEDYSNGRKCWFYSFASHEKQLEYDMAWHRVGRVIKELQTEKVLPRDWLPLYHVERIILSNSRKQGKDESESKS
ncbi:hypothetical protein D6817_01430 [Candidatus Pacearchaeota archaeon]|nr:MAG: hypothetical protein D6817_01430 [Candidatus Pacearchaeota archaeon]